MKPIFIKILCWVLGIGTVGYIGLTVANSFPGISGLVGKVPVVNSIPTPPIDSIAQATLKDSCKSDYVEGAEIKVVRISDAPESEGSYHRWECVAINPDATEEEYQKYLEELGKYKEWPRDPNYDMAEYFKAECKYYGGFFAFWDRTNDRGLPQCVCAHPFQTESDYKGALQHFETAKKSQDSSILYGDIAFDIWEVIDYSKE